MHRAQVVVRAACLLLALACGKVSRQARTVSVAGADHATGGQPATATLPTLLLGGAAADPADPADPADSPEPDSCACDGTDFGVSAKLDEITYQLTANAAGGVCAETDPPHVRITSSCGSEQGELNLVGSASPNPGTTSLRVDGNALTLTLASGAEFRGTLTPPWGTGAGASSGIVLGTTELTVTDEIGGSHRLRLSFRLCADFWQSRAPC